MQRPCRNLSAVTVAAESYIGELAIDEEKSPSLTILSDFELVSLVEHLLSYRMRENTISLDFIEVVRNMMKREKIKSREADDILEAFRFLFKELLQNEEMFNSSDILWISDFGWCELEDDVKELIPQAKNGGMKFYGLAVADHLWMGFGRKKR